jgi:Ca2+-binding RTX toxin-like protein
MATDQEYALLSLRVYDRFSENKGPLPEGWVELIYKTDDPATGFSAGCYRHTATGEIVIAYTGTNGDRITDFTEANIPAAFALPSSQVVQALQFVSDVRNLVSSSAALSFTGHSLGGGLASLMAIYFNEDAVLFDSAPFKDSAHSTTLGSDGLDTYAMVQVYFNAYKAYQQTKGRVVDTAFEDYADAFDSVLQPGSNTLFDAREGAVRGIYTQGEVLQLFRLALPYIGDNFEVVSPGENSVGGSELHSMALLAALKMSPAFVAALNRSTVTTDLLFDADLYKRADPATAIERDFLTDLVRNHVGVEGKLNADGNELLDTFAHDVEAVTPNDEDLLPEELRAGLVAGIMEYYWEGSFLQTNDEPEEFVEVVDGGMRLDFERTATHGDDLGRHRLADAASGMLEDMSHAAPSALNSITSWYVQGQPNAVLTGSNVDDVLIGSTGAELHGGDGNDVLILYGDAGSHDAYGGAGLDLIYGSEGDDWIDGGLNNDLLFGGDGDDIYSYFNGEGMDTIIGDDDGSIRFDNVTLSGDGAEDRGSPSRPIWTWSGGGLSFTYSLFGATAITYGDRVYYINGVLTITQSGVPGSIVVEDFSSGDLGLNLYGDLDDDTDKPGNAMDDANIRVDPMALDLDGDGVETRNVGLGAHFDHDTNGFAEQTGWLGRDDGFLVRDLNGNGEIDNGGELFGNNTLLANGSYAADGFLALAELDSNHDGKVSSADATFSQLRIWKDLDSDGVTDAGELLTLSAAGVASINTAYMNSLSVDSEGNQHLQRGTYTTTGGAVRAAEDLWFAANPESTHNIIEIEVSPEIAALPEVAGFGNVTGLRQAMEMDASRHLRDLVLAFGAETNRTARNALLDQIVFAWTGVENVAANSRGAYVADARTLEALEEFVGRTYVQGAGVNAGTTSPNSTATNGLLTAFRDLTGYINGQLMAQTHLAPLYQALTLQASAPGVSPTWDVSGAVAMLQASYTANPTTGFERLADFVASLGTDGARGIAVLAALRDLGDLEATGLLRDLLTVNADTLLEGTSGNNTLTGTANADYILGYEGDDTLQGNADSDILDGGAGADSLSGGAGSDTYLFGIGSGADTINNYDLDPTGIDVLEFGANIASGQVHAARSGDHLVFTVDGTTDQVTVTNYFQSDTTSSYAIDAVRFHDGTTLDRAALNQQFVAQGTAGNDSLRAFPTGNVLHGFGGRDTLIGGLGNDTLHGDDGDDTLTGGAGADTLVGGAGNDWLTGGFGNNTYVFARGDGEDIIWETTDVTPGKLNTLEFAAGIAPSDILLSQHNGRFRFGIAGTQDAVEISMLMYDDPTNPVQQVRFANGTIWDMNALVAQYFAGTPGDDYLVATTRADTLHGAAGRDTLEGWAGDDTLYGDEGDDSIWGYDGADTLYGGDGVDWLNGMTGNDIIVGGAGNDRLAGDAADDTYIYARGDGSDVIQEWWGSDTLQFAAGIAPGDISLFRYTYSYMDDLVIVVDNGSAQVTVEGHYTTQTSGLDDRLERITFADGTVWDLNYINSHATAPSSTSSENQLDPILHGPLAAYAQITETRQTVRSSLPGILQYEQANWYVQTPLDLWVQGNGLNNILAGNSGDNSLSGKAGRDYLQGGEGDDTYNFNVGDGVDIITNYDAGFANSTDIINWYVVPESVQFTRAGDMLVMTSGSDTIGLYNYFADAAYRIDGIVFSSTNQWSAADVWSRASILTAPASVGSDVIAGSVLDDVLDGGNGADTMSGGAGHDTYFVDDVGDVVIEESGLYNMPYRDNGTVAFTREEYYYEIINSSVSFTASQYVERLNLLGSSNISGTGNASDNWLQGNAGANTLHGLDGRDYLDGGAGADSMEGGLGDDTYIVDHVGDAIVEATEGGWETVNSSASHTLAANVENLYLTGDADLAGTGNAGSNSIYGNSGANVLIGGDGDDRLQGNGGTDTLIGGVGSDYYIVHDVSDIVLENAAEGIDDRIDAFVSLTIADNVERLSSAASDITLRGNAASNILYTQRSGNVLDGGAGNDVLRTYGVGDTVFVFGRGYGFDLLAGYFGGVIRFNADVAPTDIIVRKIGLDTYLNIAGTNDYVCGDYTFGAYSAVFADGTQWSIADIANMATSYVNQAPSLGSGVADHRVDTAVSTQFTVLAGSFLDPDLMDQFVYTAALESGSALPSWLTFSNGTFTANPTATHYGAFNIRVTATDAGGAAVSDVFTLTVADSDQYLVGTADNDVLTAKTGNDTLDGGAGADQMSGKKGNDIYFVDVAGDTVIEATNEGNDTVRSTINHTLGSNVENLTLLGTANLSGTGNSATNILIGNSGNNTLSGLGGADIMQGGAGSDSYVVENIGDVVDENAGEGTDSVQSSVTHILSANVENLTFTGSSAIAGTGNALDNVLTGNSGNNTLTGGGGNDTLNGGSGTDTMNGGTGNDTFVVAQTGDVANENSNEGIDLVQSSVTFTLGANVENLLLTGSSAVSGTGNTLDNLLTGNSGSNTLTGNAGNDTLDGGTGGTDALRGGQGNDIYVVGRTTGITITENASEGTDTVHSSVNHTLGSNLENLTLTGTNAITGTGNSVANVLTGNAGNNTLTGAAGNDTLTGGNGADIYSYSSGHGADTINNASTDSAQDRLNVTNLTRSQVTFTRSVNDLVMTRNGTPTDSVRVTDWFIVTGNQLDFVQFTDQTLSSTQINSLFGSGLMSAPAGSESVVSARNYELDSAALQFIDAMNHFDGKQRRSHIIMDGGSKDRLWESDALAANGGPAAERPHFMQRIDLRETRVR